MIVLLIISILVLFLVERWSIRHGLDPADRAEHLPGIGLDVDTHARR